MSTIVKQSAKRGIHLTSFNNQAGNTVYSLWVGDYSELLASFTNKEEAIKAFDRVLFLDKESERLMS